MGLGRITEFIAYPDYDLKSIEGESLLMPLLEGAREYPDDYFEMRGLFLERVELGTYRRKGTWRIGGENHLSGDEGYSKVVVVGSRSLDRTAFRTECGLDQEEYASLWDGDAYILKII